MTEDEIKYELEMRIISFMTFKKEPLSSINSIDLINSFLEEVHKPVYIEEKCSNIEYIAFMHSLIEQYKNEDLFYRFDRDELLKYKPLYKNMIDVNMTPLKQIKKQYPWIYEKDKEILLHDDIDGLLSFLYMRDKLNWQMKGYYNLQEFYLKENSDKDLDKYIYLDLDVNENRKNIGHHFLLIDNPYGLNMNSFFLERTRENYVNKCPLPTILVLCWLMEDKETISDVRKLAWIVYADSFIISYKKYKRNCTEWLDKLEMYSVLEELEKNEKEHHIDKIILEEVIPTIQKFKTYWNTENIDVTEYNLNQCNLQVNKNKDKDLYYIKDFTEYYKFVDSLNNIFCFKNIERNDLALYKLEKIESFYKYSINYHEDIYGDIKRKGIISNAITFCSPKKIQVQVTLKNPISENEKLNEYIIGIR